MTSSFTSHLRRAALALAALASLHSASAGLITNGSFESGLAGWTIADLASPLLPVGSRGSGYNNGYGLFTQVATDGNYSLSHGFDGGNGTIRISQSLGLLDLSSALLSFDYRVGWDLLSYTFGSSSLDRIFTVELRATGSGTLLSSTEVFRIPQDTVVLDTGVRSGAINFAPYTGQNATLSFVFNVPESFTGPAFFMLDNVRLSPAAISPVPEPATWGIWGCLAMGAAAAIRRRKKSKTVAGNRCLGSYELPVILAIAAFVSLGSNAHAQHPAIRKILEGREDEETALLLKSAPPQGSLRLFSLNLDPKSYGVTSVQGAETSADSKLAKAGKAAETLSAGSATSLSEKFNSWGWGGGVAAIAVLGDAPVDSASPDANGILRVTHASRARVGMVLEAHYPLKEFTDVGLQYQKQLALHYIAENPTPPTVTVPHRTLAIGAITELSEEVVRSIGVGFLWLNRRYAIDQNGTITPSGKPLNLGLYAVLDPKVKGLANGLKANQAVPTGTPVAFEDKPRFGVALLVSLEL